MNTKDILLFNSESGGDFAITNNDLLMGESLYQQIYLALFGGNIEDNTKSKYLESEDRFDYWANSLFWKDSKTKQFNSKTERAIQNNALNSSGRLNILQAILSDLDYLKLVINFTAEVFIASPSRLNIVINFSEISNQQDKVLQLVYDNSKKEVIIDKVI